MNVFSSERSTWRRLYVSEKKPAMSLIAVPIVASGPEPESSGRRLLPEAGLEERVEHVLVCLVERALVDGRAGVRDEVVDRDLDHLVATLLDGGADVDGSSSLPPSRFS